MTADNPLLQDFGMIVHPPLLYLGYVGFAVSVGDNEGSFDILGSELGGSEGNLLNDGTPLGNAELDGAKLVLGERDG